MKHFIFQNDITKEHLIVDANNVTEALYIMTVNPVLIDHTYVGCTETVITKYTNADKNVEDKIEQFVKLCRITELAKEVAKLPTLKAQAMPSKSSVYYIRYMILVKIKDRIVNNIKCNSAFIDLYINCNAIKKYNNIIDALKIAIDNHFYKDTIYLVDIIKYEGQAIYTADKVCNSAVAFTAIFPSDTLTDVTFDNYQNQAYLIKNGTFTYYSTLEGSPFDVDHDHKPDASPFDRTDCDKFEAISDKAKK